MHTQGEQRIPVLVYLTHFAVDVVQHGGVVRYLGFRFGAYDALEPLQHLFVLDFQLVEHSQHLLVELNAGDAFAGVVALVVDGAAVVVVLAAFFVFHLAQYGASAVAAGDEAVAVNRLVTIVGLFTQEHLDAVEGGEVDDRFVLTFRPVATEIHFADVGAVGQNCVELAPHEVGVLLAINAAFVVQGRNKTVQAVLMIGVQVEDVGHILCLFRIDADKAAPILAVVFVAVGCATGKQTRHNAALDAFRRADGKLVAIELADDGEHVGIEFSRRGLVKRLRDAHDLDAMLVPQVNEIDPVLHIAGGAVYLVKKQTVHRPFAFSGAIDHLVERFPLLALVGHYLLGCSTGGGFECLSQR